MTQEQINEIRRRCDAATPGPWISKNKSVRTLLSDGEERALNSAPTGWQGGICNCLGCSKWVDDKNHSINDQAVRNAKFIAAARQDIPALLEALEAERKQADEAEAKCQALLVCRT